MLLWAPNRTLWKCKEGWRAVPPWEGVWPIGRCSETGGKQPAQAQRCRYWGCRLSWVKVGWFSSMWCIHRGVFQVPQYSYNWLLPQKSRLQPLVVSALFCLLLTPLPSFLQHGRILLFSHLFLLSHHLSLCCTEERPCTAYLCANIFVGSVKNEIPESNMNITNCISHHGHSMYISVCEMGGEEAFIFLYEIESFSLLLSHSGFYFFFFCKEGFL